jgi:dTDP-4-dehydrorhamnose reductase
MILITGANGFVGHRLIETLKDTIPAPSLRNATQDDIKCIIEKSGADVIIHTAAIADIGICQSNPDMSYFANVQIPLYIAKASKGKKLICFSSDQVYSACSEEGAYFEDVVNPGNIYASHKLEMEQRVLDILPSSVMLRAEWMYDMHSHKGNYLTNLLNAEKSVSFSSSQYRGITYLKEVAENMDKVIALPGGVYNFGSETTQSMYEITKEYISILKKDILVQDAPIRHNLWMNCEKAKRYGIEFSEVLTGLIRCAKDYKIIE